MTASDDGSSTTIDLRLIVIAAARLIRKIAPEPGDDPETFRERYAMALELRNLSDQASAALGGESTRENLECARTAAIAALQRVNSKIEQASFRISLSPSAEVH